MIRLFAPDNLEAGAIVAAAPEQAHYLTRVMRLGLGGAVALFNGRDGEWSARISGVSRRGATLTVEGLVRPQTVGPDLDLLVALVKRARLETIIEKATELGARRVRLITTRRTNADHTNVARLTAIAVEAAEQTGRLDVPEIVAPEKLESVLAAWPVDRRLMFCDEAGDASPALTVMTGAAPGVWAILIGPEGGFAPEERAAVRAVPASLAVNLGPNILRADTAAIAALTLWQAALGDWRHAP